MEPIAEALATARSYIPLHIQQPIYGALGGHVVTLLVGEKVGFAASLAMAYYGTQELDVQAVQTLALATGFYILPSVVTQVASTLITTAIIETVSLGVRGVRALCCCGSDPRDEKIGRKKIKIKQLKAEQSALKIEMAARDTEIVRLKKELQGLLQQFDTAKLANLDFVQF